jgi:hypothetical protein
LVGVGCARRRIISHPGARVRRTSQDDAVDWRMDA